MNYHHLLKSTGPAGPSYALNFMGDVFPAGLSNTRTVAATQTGPTGMLEYNPQNYFQNSVFAGAVVGVIGSGGVRPTGLVGGVGSNVNLEIVGKGVLPDGTPYMDFRIFGTNATGALIYPHMAFPVTALVGQIGTGTLMGYSHRLSLIAGSSTGFNSFGRPMLQWLNSAGTYISQAGTYPLGFAPPNNDINIRQSAYGATSASTDRITGGIEFSVVAGGSVDATFRWAGPSIQFWSLRSPIYVPNTSTTSPYQAPRLDYDPMTLTRRGFLYEGEGRTNLNPTSASDWNNNSAASVAVLSKTAAGAEGFPSTAWLMTEGLVSGSHYGIQASAASVINYVTGTVYAVTALVSAGTANRCQLAAVAAAFGGGQFANFSLVGEGEVLATTGVVSARIRLVGNGYYACTIVVTATITASGNPVVVSFIDSNAATRIPAYTGTGLTLKVHHTQIEVGSFATSIIPTYGVTITRQADLCTVALGSWFTKSQGTVFADWTGISPSPASTRVVSINPGGAGNLWVHIAQSSAGAVVAQTSNGTVVSAGTGNNAYTPFVNQRMAAAVNATALTTAINGTNLSSGVLTGLPTDQTQLEIGGTVNGSRNCMWIKAFAFFPRAMSASELRKITRYFATPVTAAPTYVADFTTGLLPAGLTFTRTSVGTRINSAGECEVMAANIPRFDYHPTTRACLGLMIEESRTNSLTHSNPRAVGNGATYNTSNGVTRTKVGEGVINGIEYVDVQFSGTFTAPENISYVFQPSAGIGSAASAGQVWTCTCHWGVVAGTLPASITANLGGSRIRYGSPGLIYQGGNAVVKTSFGKDVFTATAPALTTIVGADWLWAFGAGQAINCTIRFGVAQLELGAFPTSYIPTSGATVTRSADVCTGSLGAWFSPYKGTLYCEADAVTSGAQTPFTVSIDDATGSNRIYFSYATGTTRLFVDSAGASAAAISLTGAIADGVTYKQAGQYSLNSFNFSTNGVAAVADTAGSVPVSLNTLRFGKSVSGNATTHLNGHLKRFEYYNVNLPDYASKELTTL